MRRRRFKARRGGPWWGVWDCLAQTWVLDPRRHHCDMERAATEADRMNAAARGGGFS